MPHEKEPVGTSGKDSKENNRFRGFHRPWNVHTSAFADDYNHSFHYIAIEISWNDRLRRSANIVRYLSIFSVVILQYFWVVVMFV